MRAFVSPGRANHSIIEVETVYRPVVSPARPDRTLEEQVPTGHPVAVRVQRALEKLVEQ